jgi:hypothetical protein
MIRDTRERLEAHCRNERRALADLLGSDAPSWCCNSFTRGR